MTWTVHDQHDGPSTAVSVGPTLIDGCNMTWTRIIACTLGEDLRAFCRTHPCDVPAAKRTPKFRASRESQHAPKICDSGTDRRMISCRVRVQPPRDREHASSSQWQGSAWALLCS